jgi:6-phospho-3-hexuloisomerase
MIKESIKVILGEMDGVLSKVDDKEVNVLVDTILKSNKVVCVGAGRVGLALKGFAMRLGHFGLEAYMLGDTTVPHIGEEDLLLACSGSGETQTIYDIVVIAKRNNAKVALVTGNPASRMGELAEVIVELKAPSKTKPLADFVSVQPMTTLNEQCLGVFFDAVVLQMMQQMGETHETMWARHSNLE